VSARFETAAKLSDEDKKAIIEIARQSARAFPAQAGPEVKPEVKVEPKAETKPD
jgi:hypothetical protein